MRRSNAPVNPWPFVRWGILLSVVGLIYYCLEPILPTIHVFPFDPGVNPPNVGGDYEPGGPNHPPVAAGLLFGPRLLVPKYDVWVSQTVFYTEAYEDGSAAGAKFQREVMVYRASTGGPIGSASSIEASVRNVRLVEHLRPPTAPPGVRGIIPGQSVVRMVPEKELDSVDDRYLVEIPADVIVKIDFDPMPSFGLDSMLINERFGPNDEWVSQETRDFYFNNRYDFAVSATNQKGKHVDIEFEWKDVGERGGRYVYWFESDDGGNFEIRVRSGKRGKRIPDRYVMFVYWDDYVTGYGHNDLTNFSPNSSSN